MHEKLKFFDAVFTFVYFHNRFILFLYIISMLPVHICMVASFGQNYYTRNKQKGAIETSDSYIKYSVFTTSLSTKLYISYISIIPLFVLIFLKKCSLFFHFLQINFQILLWRFFLFPKEAVHNFLIHLVFLKLFLWLLHMRHQ